MTDKKYLALFCSVLIAGFVVISGCIQESGQVPSPVPAATLPGGDRSSAGTPFTGAASASFCAVPLNVTVTESPDFASHFIGAEVLTRPTDHSGTVSVVTGEDLDLFITYGTVQGSPSCRTPAERAEAGSPLAISLSGLIPDTQYYYRTCFRTAGTPEFSCGPEHTFRTQRSAGSTFSFGILADSHPEREKTMFNAGVYTQTLQNIARDRPDFVILLGDDFSIDPLIDRGQLSRQAVDEIYLSQRKYLSIPGSSSPVFLVNGNHEQAAQYLLDGTAGNAAVFAGTARMQYFPQPVPDGFYTGNTEAVPYVGLPGDYYAWTWGDALFVVIDPYWHSPVSVDNLAGKNAHQKKDMWEITLGDDQYAWFKRTLSESTARYKFVFAHHVLGTGRGGIEEAGLYEWGGRNPKGTGEFATRRPGWEAPIHQLMAENGVSIFFQGHDHLYARQELDGVIYQEVPIPADPTYSLFNADAYTSGVKLPNSGYLRVTVSPANTTVDYVKTFLEGKGTGTERNGEVAYSYAVAGTTTGEAGR